MAAPAPHNIRIYKGATLRDTVTWKSGNPKVPVDLTGCTARAQIRASVGDATVLLSLTTENGGITLGGTAGTITLNIEADVTTALTWTSGVYQFEIEFTDGYVRRLFQGSVTVFPEVTL